MNGATALTSENRNFDSGRNGMSADVIISEVLHSVRMLLEMQVAFVSEFSNRRRILRFVDCCDEFAPVQVGDSDPLDETYCQRVMDGRFPELINDTAKHPEARQLAITEKLSIGNHLCVPIKFKDGTTYGAFCCFCSRPNESLKYQHLEVLRLSAGLIGHVLQRKTAESPYREVSARIGTVLSDERFTIVYQPIIHVAEHRVVGHGALARFLDEPIRPPDRWFSDAAEVGRQEELELAVIKKALEGLAWFSKDEYMSFNVSPETIVRGSIGGLLEGYPLERLVLEVTEHALVMDYSSIANELAPLRKRGLRLAVDDAGAGFASFRHILKLKPDIIKLDSSLIQRIDIDLDSRALAAALIRFAEETGSKIIAEGVETESELRVLRELKVSKVQGFLLGRPRLVGPDSGTANSTSWNN